MPLTLSPVLSPTGHFLLAPSSDAPPLPDSLQRQLQEAFGRSPGHALLHLGLREVSTALPPVFAFWRDFAARYVTALCTSAETSSDDTPVGSTAAETSDDDTPAASITAPPGDAPGAGATAAPSKNDLNSLIATAPPMAGGEYLTATVLESLWNQIDAACREERTHSKRSLQEYLKANNPAWNLVGRVHFNLAENRADEEAPFAFIATYTTKLSAQGRAQHLPLGEALREYAGAKNKTRLLSLLRPVQQATTQCGWLRAMVDTGEIYHPLRWTAPEAFQFLTDVPALEGAGIVVRSPSAWKTGRPARPKVKATVGGNVPSVLGKDALLDFTVELTLGDERLTAAEIRSLLAGSDGLHFLRGRWVEVDRKKLSQLLDRFRRVEQAAAAGGLPFAEAMRLMAALRSRKTPPMSRIPLGPPLSPGPGSPRR